MSFRRELLAFCAQHGYWGLVVMFACVFTFVSLASEVVLYFSPTQGSVFGPQYFRLVFSAMFVGLWRLGGKE